MNILCVIPARYASTRLPGKPLIMLAGKPMIQHVYEQAKKAVRPKQVIVATDHELVKQAVDAFGGNVIMTSPDHATGTDRLAEVASHYDNIDIVINVQGDEPLIAPEVIDQLAAVFDDASPDVVMATLMTNMDENEYNNPAAVKVVTDLNGHALYFSRSMIPFPRNKHKGLAVYKHIGVYAYRRDFLLHYAALPTTPLEQAESLEQLRVLEHGYKIKVLKTDFKSVGVDTPEDAQIVNEILIRDGGLSK
ncbi:MAG: kdsB [Firmicutes bacterium]|nr:kdsB [Bacillota bacterium]